MSLCFCNFSARWPFILLVLLTRDDIISWSPESRDWDGPYLFSSHLRVSCNYLLLHNEGDSHTHLASLKSDSTLVAFQGQFIYCTHMHHRLSTHCYGDKLIDLLCEYCWVKDHCHLPRSFRSCLKCGEFTNYNFLEDLDPMEISHIVFCWADYLWLCFDLMYLYW